jgi:hypothetical protein
MSALTAKDDLFHPVPDDHHTWTETNWFGMMFIPEKQLQFDLYAWFHPNLRCVYSFFYVSKGIKKNHLAADYFDSRCWLPMPKGNLDNYTLENGLSVKVLKPLMTYQLDYVDRARETELHVIWDAIMPPYLFPRGEHFEQAGRVKGTLRFEGEEHEVNCLVVRDHSWVHRPEAPKLGRRPIGFVACAFEDGTAFCLTIPDSNYKTSGNASEAPPWLTQTEAPPGEFVPFCWLHKDGGTRQIRSAKLTTRREADGFRPTRFHVDFVDERQERYVIQGETLTYYPLHQMQNNMFACCIARFSLNGVKAWGAYYEVMENDVVKALLK